MLDQRFRIHFIPIRHAILPASEQNANPFVGQSSNGGVVFFATLDLEFVVRPCPTTPSARMLGELLKALTHKFRASPPPVHPAFGSTLLGDRSNARKLLHLLRGLKAIPIRAECRR